MLIDDKSLVVPYDEIYDWCRNKIKHRDTSVTWAEKCAYQAVIYKLDELKRNERKEEYTNGTKSIN